MKLPYADQVNYWKTGSTSADRVMEKAAAVIEKLGGVVTVSAFGRDPNSDRGAYMLAFTIAGTHFKSVWPVLRTSRDTDADKRSAKIQAASFLYHEVKARAINAAVLGPQRAFFEYILLEDGRTAGEVALGDIAGLPNQFAGQKLLGSKPE